MKFKNPFGAKYQCYRFVAQEIIINNVDVKSDIQNGSFLHHDFAFLRENSTIVIEKIRKELKNVYRKKK